jgi:HAE1 family hydrophobic/amphiphilic exporter-1
VNTLAEICIKRPVFAVMMIVAMVVVGAVAFAKLQVDRLPAVDLPSVNVRTSLPGASPEEVETQVSQVIEEAVNTIEGIEELRSISAQGNSLIIATFNLRRDIDTAAQDVRDRVAAIARRLPDDAEPPVISKFDNDSSSVVTIALSGEMSIRELTEVADKIIRPRIERSAGVGQVQIVGGLERTINVDVDADKLAALGIPITQVRDALERQNSDVPGGNVTGGGREQVLRTMGRLQTPDAFNDVIVAVINDTPIRIRDIGTAVDGTRERRSASRLDGVNSVSIEVRRQSGANTVGVIEGVRRELAALTPTLPAGTQLKVIRDQSTYIYSALHEIERHLVLGAILASLVVLVFMRSWRSTLIAAVAIPASVISTFGVMWALDFTLNSVTMLALVLMVGIVIDDAIVVLENIYKLIEEEGLSPFEAARRGTREISLAVLATTLSLVVIFVPVSFMSSISGRFLYQFGVTAAAAVLVSLLVSFSLTPMMASRMLRPKPAKATHVGEAHTRRGLNGLLDRVYAAALRWCVRFKIITLLAAALVVASSVPLYGLMRQDYIPSDVDEAEFNVNVNGPEGVSFEAFDAAFREVEARVREHPAVVTTQASVGGSFLGQINRGEIYVRIAPHAQRYLSISRFVESVLKGDPAAAFKGNYKQSDVIRDLRRQLQGFRDLRVSIRPFAAFNIGGGNFDIDIALRGPELEKLAEYTEILRARSRELGGLPDIDTTLKLNTPELRVEIDRDRAADLGVSPRDIGTALRLLVGGQEEVTRFRDPKTNEDYDVQLRLAGSDRAKETDLPMLIVPAPASSTKVTELRSLATITSMQTAARIDRLDRQRAANIRGTVGTGYALADRLAALRAEIDKLNLPDELLGKDAWPRPRTGEHLQRVPAGLCPFNRLHVHDPRRQLRELSASAHDPLLAPALDSLRIPELWATGESLNLYSALGILVLFGIVKKNSILQVDHINHLHTQGGMPIEDAVIQANRDRLRPILMTTLRPGRRHAAAGVGHGAPAPRSAARWRSSSSAVRRSRWCSRCW